MSQSSGRQVAAPRGVGAELHALREEMHASQVRAYDRELVLWSELARMRKAWRAAVRRNEEWVPLLAREVVLTPAGDQAGSGVLHVTHRTLGLPAPTPERAYALQTLDEVEVAKLHGLGAKGAMR